ncbi:MAG TPA: hypothetical protein VG797_06525 [Phycisphaerales bacterium]|nr:hypothetical protein [Phycisphaerales bacterium]
MNSMHALFALGAFSAASGIAQAGLITTWEYTINASDGSSYAASANPGSWTAGLLPNGDTVVHGEFEAASWSIVYDLVFSDDFVDDDPLVTSNYNVINTSGDTLGFDTLTTLFVGPMPTNKMRGSISGSVGDNTLLGDTATMSAYLDSPAYRALVDGVSVQTLLDPFAGVTTLPNGTEVVGPEDFGVPAYIPGPAINTSIAIRNMFMITADDSVGLQSTLNLVPAPGAVALMGLAGLVATRRRK